MQCDIAEQTEIARNPYKRYNCFLRLKYTSLSLAYVKKCWEFGKAGYPSGKSYIVSTSPFRDVGPELVEGTLPIPREAGLRCSPLCQTDQSEISGNTRGKWNGIFVLNKANQEEWFLPIFVPFLNPPTYHFK